MRKDGLRRRGNPAHSRPDLDEIAEAIRHSGAGSGQIKSRKWHALNREVA
jgi:hypothetical protein